MAPTVSAASKCATVFASPGAVLQRIQTQWPARCIVVFRVQSFLPAAFKRGHDRQRLGCRLPIAHPHGRIVHCRIQLLNLLAVVREIRPSLAGDGSTCGYRLKLLGNRRLRRRRRSLRMASECHGPQHKNGNDRAALYRKHA